MRALDAHTDLIKTAFIRANTPFMLFRADGRLIYENKAAYEFTILTYGMEINSMADKRFKDHPVSIDWLSRMRECRNTPRINRWSASYPIYNTENSFTHRSCTLTPFFDKAGAVDSFLGECTDITRMMDTEQRLQIKNNQMSAVAFTARHDLRGSLDGLLFAIDLIHETFSKTQLKELGLDSAMEMIRMEVEKQTSILEGMKDWLEMIEGGAIKKESVNLREVLEQLKRNSLYKGAVILEALPALEGSRGQFSMLFDNLIKNGLHYNDNANPRVKVYADGGAILVEDNGNGFPIAKFELLCKPFQRLDTDKIGSGLGLAIVKGICDNHGFVFSAESKLGKGSRFRIQYT